ncbi:MULTISPECIES: glycine betaine ABC transporter substrate-binding protein [unclassified Achromobacter]|uniref:glycine betaine ABC transporter substrate-binding protein n=1 Tax=unclassified Achromobacter TaxID=2626865 RepID=UPI001E3D65F0|nr:MULTISPECIES: glycine betaine ABC transporter substrate-binding protein [unclassified Achromobacter]
MPGPIRRLLMHVFRTMAVILAMATATAMAMAAGTATPGSPSGTASNAAGAQGPKPITTATAPEPAQPGAALRIGSKRFTESYILAEVLAQAVAARTGETPVVRQGLGNTAIVYQALQTGGIDLYPEYEGTIVQEILRSDRPLTLAQMRPELARLGLSVDIPLGFNDGYALAMRAADADRLGIATLSDLARHPDQRLGLSNEFIGRADGWRGLAQRYGYRQAPIGLDHGLAYDALRKGQVDVIDIYTTDAKIKALGLRVLRDDLGYFPRYDAVVLHRLDLPQRQPRAWAAMQALAGSIDESAMITMNARAELDGVPFQTIAHDWLAARQRGVAPPEPGGEARGFWAKLFGPDLGRLTAQHLLLVGVAVLVACMIAVPAGILVHARPRLRALALGVAGLLQTIPSLALLAVLISLTGAIGALPALTALMLYALLPIFSNTCAGLGEVSGSMRQAAIALGMTSGQALRLVQFPLARPTILTGVRTATSIAIGTATIAAFIGAGGYGERIVTGLALNDRALMLAGAAPAAALALISELLFEALQWRLRRHTRR